MSSRESLFVGNVVLPNRVSAQSGVHVRDGRIHAVGSAVEMKAAASPGATIIDAGEGFVSPGFVDLHVHGGDGSDFMDVTPEAFKTICRAHARHGTTSLLPTTTVGTHEQLLAFLALCRRFRQENTGGARVLGAHFYGPYFNYDARGAHPAAGVRAPEPSEYLQYLAFSDCIVTATVAPELSGAEGFVKACRAANLVCNAGHTHATFEQMEKAVSWGVRHIDHLYCAMSDRARLRQTQPFPMRGGVMEATLYFDDLTTEVIADGVHLTRELLLLALKCKGPDRLALVTDSNRALDMPDGEYLMGPLDGGNPVLKRGNAGLTIDGLGLGSSVSGMIHCVRTFWKQTGVPLEIAIRMASLTPARIAERDAEVGSLAVGKRADVLVLDRELAVKRVFVDGIEVPTSK